MFHENKTLGDGEITLSFTDIGKSSHSREFLTSQICVLTLFAKIKFSQKFLNVHYLRKIITFMAKLMVDDRVFHKHNFLFLLCFCKVFVI